tara:strand:- start:1468 stop:1707 length:240 start_codon:yes stop_codon:yes gene_type:complete
MKMKLLGSVISNPTDNNIGTATLVHVVATSATTLTLKAAGGSTLGTIYIPANGSIDLVKDATDTISAGTSNCTKIAYIS